MSRYTQPSLLWALVEDYARRTEEGDFPPGQHDYELTIYRTDQPGAWTMHSAKLYWSDEPGGQYFSNCPQNSLANNEGNIGEIILFRRRARRTEILGIGIESAIQKLTTAT